jgi:hypothetical protein
MVKNIGPNTQKAYEKIRKWLTRPGASQAMHSTEDTCTYYNSTTKNRCAVGCLFTKKTAESLADSLVSVTRLVKINDDAARELEGISTNFLLAAQQCHDDYWNWATGKFDVKKLDAIARRHRLKVIEEA